MYGNVQQEDRRRIVPTHPEEIQEGAHVLDYDELDGPVQQKFLSAISGERSCGIDELDSGDIVVFTDYYRVRDWSE